jgi:hypothetical protein
VHSVTFSLDKQLQLIPENNENLGQSEFSDNKEQFANKIDQESLCKEPDIGVS